MPEPGEGSEREMDVLIEGEINGEPVRIAVEARDHQEPQDVTWIDALIGKYQLLRVDVVIAVSRSGFTSGAEQKASLHNIRTLTVKELDEGNWPSGFTRFGFRFLERGVQLVGFMLGFYPEHPEAEGKVDGNQLLVDRSGAPAGTLGELLQKLADEHLIPGADEVARTRAKDVLTSGADEVQPFTVTLRGGGYFWPLDDGRRLELTEVLLDARCRLAVITPEARHFGYRRAAVSVARMPVETGSTVAVVAVQDPTSPGQVKISMHRGKKDATPG